MLYIRGNVIHVTRAGNSFLSSTAIQQFVGRGFTRINRIDGHTELPFPELPNQPKTIEEAAPVPPTIE
jgi:hypothetical protein